MTTDPQSFLRETFPGLFNKGVELLRGRASGGDERAQRILDDVTGVTGAAAVQIDDASPVYLCTRQGQMVAGDSPQGGVDVKLVAAVPGNAVDMLLGEAAKDNALENEEVAIGAAQTASKRLEDMLEGRPMTCHVIVRGVPELGDVTARVGFNVPEPPAEPGFTTEIQYSDLEAMRAGSVTVQELFMGGKLKMEGDYSVALQISMQLMTNPL